MKALVFGPTGQVGRHLTALLPDARAITHSEADLADGDLITTLIHQERPDVVLNCAAFTAVDRAESEPAAAWQTNAEGPANLARAAAEVDAVLVHLSTDYVFDGQTRSEWSHLDAVNPTNTYGRTKLAGEMAVASLAPKHWIIRTSWVFSEFGANFVKTMIRLAGERDELGVVNDQHGRPSYAGDIARVMMELVSVAYDADSLPWGTYHLSGGPPTTWFGFANTIFERAAASGLIDQAPRVTPISTDAYPTPARRPSRSGLLPSEELHRRLDRQPDWERGLDQVLASLHQ